ncbi:oxygenase MpaB family protein [Streptomyces sp. B-S-A8]|uniref:Oxygenase MpaB family protein n=1 Tax=Streptomyces solicavernae TaxID=3043614 RepID=A0ABT6RSV4_9ACTN|nr:oxygenase MpaB family protein [Streptomyces sp. B-S-A8]MDI3387509.1 oxygenase MpaB family protein [Streptomyces sp. B-S-A8]
MTQISEVRDTTRFPRRFREAEERGRRIARGIFLFADIGREIDEPLMERVGQALLERDELGAALAEAMRLPAGDPGRVTHAQIGRALLAAPDVPRELPPALRELLDQATAVPDWVDWDRIERGAAAYRYLGRNAGDVLTLLSLIGGYRFGGPPDLLVRTGGLTGGTTLRRLGETTKWTNAVTRAGGLWPGAEGWRLTVHVRAMHALVNARFEPRWDTARWGLPVNQADQAATLGLFDGTVIVGCLGLGVRLTRVQRDDLMHLWRYVGWLMGVSPQWLTDDENVRHRWNYHILLAAAGQTQAGRDLARQTLNAQAERDFGHGGGALQRLHQRYERARQASLLSVFVGRDGMRDLGLRRRLPWALLLALAGNTARYRVLGALPGGRERLESRGTAVQERLLATMFPDSPAAVGQLPEAVREGGG